MEVEEVDIYGRLAGLPVVWKGLLVFGFDVRGLLHESLAGFQTINMLCPSK